jgi:hypothetical protein
MTYSKRLIDRGTIDNISEISIVYVLLPGSERVFQSQPGERALPGGRHSGKTEHCLKKK